MRRIMRSQTRAWGRAAKYGSRSMPNCRRTWKNLRAGVRARLPQTLGPDISLAMLVVDNATGEVRAHIGSPDYFDQRRAGQVDLTQALRSPGSTLKPFIYGLGFEDGFIHPETLVDDRPTRYGGYKPQNFDFTFQGTVTVRRRIADVAQPAGARGARSSRREPSHRAADASRRNARAAGRRGAGACDRPWRGRHQALRSGDALCRHRAARHGLAAD